MSTTAGFFLVVALIAGAVLIHRRYIKPLQRLRRDLASLAGGRFELPAIPEASTAYRVTAGHILKIAELLRQLDRQTAEEGLSLRRILSAMREGILIVNRDGRITLVNEALQRFFPGAKSPIGRSLLEVLRRHELDQAVTHTLAGGRDQHIELTFDSPGPGGTVAHKHYDIHIAAMSREDGDHPRAALVVLQDVTAIRTLEATRREFVANVSHEFRTPLTVINGFVETLLDGATEDPAMTSRSLSAIHRNVQRLSLLLEDLLTISSLENRARLLDFQPVNLRETMERVCDNLQPGSASRAVVFKIEWGAGAEFAEADPHRIEQVYWNLLSNAIRHAEADPLIVTVTAARAGDSIQMEFSDNGTGIPLEDHAHIFERFYRVHKHRARDAGGTGLGLSIVKNIILAHGGQVSLRSTPGDGATFCISLPVEQNEKSCATFPASRGLNS